MDHILCLVDFTDTANIALEQSIALARAKNLGVSICHILPDTAPDDEEEELRDKLQPMCNRVERAGLKCELQLERGQLFEEVEEIVKRTHPYLVVVGTHGKRGLRQNLFGSDIYKLVRHISVPTLVVNDNSKVVKDGFRKVMLPVASHPDYLTKVEQTCRVLAQNGTVYIFEIHRPGEAYSDQMGENMEATKKYLDEQGVRWKYLEKDSDHYSVGFSRETLEYAGSHNFDLISIMTNVSEENRSFGKADKENLLLNQQGLPVLCANHA